MHASCVILVACLAASGAACKEPPGPVTRTQTVGLWLNGERVGEERAVWTNEEHRSVLEVHTDLSGPAVVRLQGTLVLERGRATALRVTGTAPDSFPALADLTTTPDRTDTFPIRGPLPVHVMSALARQSMAAGKRQFHALPGGVVTLDACPGAEGPFTDATCHRIAGLPSGPAFVWLGTRRELTAAVARTPWGVLVATPPERDAAHPAVLERFDVYSAPD